jgi:hypothetical protein
MIIGGINYAIRTTNSGAVASMHELVGARSGNGDLVVRSERMRVRRGEVR